MEGNAAEQSASSTIGKITVETVVPGYGLSEVSSGKVAGTSVNEPTGKVISKIVASAVKNEACIKMSFMNNADADTEEPPPTKRLREQLEGTKRKDTEEEDENTLENVSTTSVAGSISEGNRHNLQTNNFLLKETTPTSPFPRKFRRIPIFIVDYHNDVLEFIYRCLATRHLPMSNNIIVHFDSHPDMVISRHIPASASFDKETMLNDLSIENWLMPTCYAGHFNRIVWLKNSWCQQMPVGKYNFKIGQKLQRIKVDLQLDYFVSEGNYCDKKELENVRDMELQVINVDTATEDAPIDTAQFIKATDAPNFVLDIDLDFFSTSNPFIDVYREANCYEQLNHIFYFESDSKDLDETNERRQLQLEMLKDIFEHLENVRSLDGLPPPDEPSIITQETLIRIQNLMISMHQYYPDSEIDWLLIYDAGSTTDHNGLPHHVSTPPELEQYFAKFKNVIQNLPVPPVLITMACSAEDDYCPKEQVEFIQERVLDVLHEVFGERLHDTPIRYYLDEEWDIMKL
ncbi:UPF0489 protein C5orf22 homolog [Anastrepha obliqua]|uniref:UPF0489 protein C5orf22 homolog n=1 Tax=Anastrepha obliqua TaxID=95512 RepID=UPI0024097214|nr:UPF0489 protein C5orf22 homolog [Anastrepha obliqua]